MTSARFEDIFEDCLSALLEGRRSIEESLSLYPAWAEALEPLLRAAQEVARGLDQQPSPLFQQEAHRRFLAAARERRLRPARRSLLPAGWWRWAPAAAAAVAAAVAISLAGATLIAPGGGGGPGDVTVRVLTPTPAPQEPQPSNHLEVVRARLEVLEEAVQGGQLVDAAVVREVVEGAKDLVEQVAEDPAVLDGAELVELAARQREVFSQIIALPASEDVKAEAEQGLTLAEQLLKSLEATPGDEATPEPEATPEVEGTPAAQEPAPAETPTPEPTAAPAPEPSPGTAEPGTSVPPPGEEP